MISNAFVKLWGERVGAVSWDSALQIGFFEYDISLIPSGLELSPLQISDSKAYENHR